MQNKQEYIFIYFKYLYILMISAFHDVEEKTIVYLWISHGTNVTQENNYYPYEFKFRSGMFYSKPFKSIHISDLKELENNPCDILTGSCPLIPQKDQHGKKQIFLPPLIFSTSAEDNNEMRHYVGLYEIELYSCTNPQNNTITPVMTWDNINSEGMVTYSKIFKYISDDCKRKNHNPKDVIVSIFSCQTATNKYEDEYAHANISFYKPTIQTINKRVKNALIFGDKPHDIQRQYDDLINQQFIALTTIKGIEPTNQFKTLAGIKHQGCALNVMSYYELFNQSFAREMTTCLTSKGTSIFEIINYINFYYEHSEVYDYEIMPIKYLIIRYEIEIAFFYIYYFFIMKLTGNHAVIFKLYADLYKRNTTEYSHVGHTVSINCYEGNIHFIDPQAEIFESIGNTSIEADDFVHTIRNIINRYTIKYTQVDIIYSIYDHKARETQSLTKIYETMGSFLPAKNSRFEIVTRDNNNDTIGGRGRGRKTTKHRKNKGKLLQRKSGGYKSNRLSTKSSKTRSKKQSSNKITRLTYFDIVRQIDAEDNFKSLIIDKPQKI